MESVQTAFARAGATLPEPLLSQGGPRLRLPDMGRGNIGTGKSCSSALPVGSGCSGWHIAEVPEPCSGCNQPRVASGHRKLAQGGPVAMGSGPAALARALAREQLRAASR